MATTMFEELLADLRQVKLPEGRDWMVYRWLSIVNAAQSLELDLDDLAEKLLIRLSLIIELA